MSEYTLGAPSRKLDEFEELVYEYTSRMGLGDGGYWGVDARSCNLRFESATRGPPATVTFLFKVTPEMSNGMGNLHGGCAATLIDVLSTTILLGLSSPGKFALGGVSRNLRVTYLRPVPTDMEVRLVCEVVHVGKRLALLRAEIQRAEGGDVCVVGEHEKANTDPEVDQRI
ncbi:hypothetical protein MYU51_004511 [Penicillium brevicompactum]|uniref:uncharacterized protein n=1 Tax=Penicillium brevicompactum TaxID=5074 RepID=UPI00254224A0|nr:uncharacterized protein N7506_007875 [Penicillium brevicompactum]KAJ5334092.1 hypothetical protein N7506_007875 [Penicillium brevicompactum]